jgi:HTH-type transcriptional regulator/antitoxin HipB
MDFTINLTSQLRVHLRALRKARGLTQTALGQQLGVGQARIAEIENNPGVVSVDQLMKVLSVLRASLVLRDGAVDAVADRSPAPASPAKPTRKVQVDTPQAGQWRMTPLTSSGRRTATSVLASPRNTGTSPDVQVREPDPQADVTATSRRSFTIRPKKGSW